MQKTQIIQANTNAYCRKIHPKYLILLLLLFLFPALNAPKAQQNYAYNKNVVGLISGSGVGTYSRFAWELAVALKHDELRVLPVLGIGSYENIEDLLKLRNISLAIVQSDVLGRYLDQKSDTNDKNNFRKKIRLVETLYNEEIHILSKSNIKDITELGNRNRTVNIGPRKSGTRATSGQIFKALVTDGILEERPSYEYEDDRVALSRLLEGKIDALVYVAGKPAPLIEDIRGDDRDRVHLLSLNGIGPPYVPANFTNDDYGNLISEQDGPIPTFAIPAFLLAYNFSKEEQKDRWTGVDRFVADFRDKLADIKLDPAVHPKWSEVELSDEKEVDGWVRW